MTRKGRGVIVTHVYYCMYYSLRREYPPLSLHKLQMFIDTNRVDPSKPIDLVSLVNTGLYDFKVEHKHAGVHLTDEVLGLIFYMVEPIDNISFKKQF